MFNQNNTWISGSVIGFENNKLKGAAIDILTGAGMNGLEGQRNLDNNHTLKFSDEETAASALDCLADHVFNEGDEAFNRFEAMGRKYEQGDF